MSAACCGFGQYRTFWEGFPSGTRTPAGLLFSLAPRAAAAAAQSLENNVLAWCKPWATLGCAAEPGWVPVTAVTAVSAGAVVFADNQSCRFTPCSAACHFYPALRKNGAVLGGFFPKRAVLMIFSSDQLRIPCAWPHPSACWEVGSSSSPKQSSTRLVLLPLFPSGTDWYPVNSNGSSSVVIPPG